MSDMRDKTGKPKTPVTEAEVDYFKRSLSEPKFIGKIPERTELKMIPAKGDQPKIGFMVHETLWNDSEGTPDYDAAVLEATKEADQYRSGHYVTYDEPSLLGWTCLDVLPNLVGRPWDQFALNMVHSVRPGCIRVVEYGQGQTLDAVTWRVTVNLEEDNRTISRISQEVDVGSVGVQHGHGLHKYELGQDPKLQQVFGNLEAIEKFAPKGEEPMITCPHCRGRSSGGMAVCSCNGTGKVPKGYKP